MRITVIKDFLLFLFHLILNKQKLTPRNNSKNNEMQSKILPCKQALKIPTCSFDINLSPMKVKGLSHLVLAEN